MNFIAARAEPTGQFLYDIRRVSGKREFFDVCERHLASSVGLCQVGDADVV
jgi:hypothetical protein